VVAVQSPVHDAHYAAMRQLLKESKNNRTDRQEARKHLRRSTSLVKDIEASSALRTAR